MDHLSTDDRIKVRDIYENLVTADWFNRNAVTERELLILVLSKVRQEVSSNLLQEPLGSTVPLFQIRRFKPSSIARLASVLKVFLSSQVLRALKSVPTHR